MAFQKRFPSHCVGLTETECSGEESTILGLCNLRISDDSILRGVPGVNPEADVPTPNTYNNDPSEFPVKVLPYLYLGNAQNSADMECLYKNGIKYILNVTPNVPNTFENEGTFKYMQIPISDHWSQNLSTWFPKAIAFIGKYHNGIPKDFSCEATVVISAGTTSTGRHSTCLIPIFWPRKVQPGRLDR